MVNYKDTRDKLLKLCDNLYDNRVISKEDYDKCKNSFLDFGSKITGDYPEPGTNKKYSFGMSKSQGINDFNVDLTTKETMRCIIKTKFGFKITEAEIEEKNNKGYEINRTLCVNDDTNTLYLNDVDAEDIITSDKSRNIIFVLQKRKNGYYTIKNEETENFIKILDTPMNRKKLEIKSNNLTDSAYFELKKKGKYYVLSSMLSPGFKMTSGNEINLTNGRMVEHNWTIEIINDDIIDSNSEFELTKNSMNVINNIINDIRNTKFKYYRVHSLINFLKKLKDLILEKSKSGSDIFKYLNNKKIKKDNNEIYSLEELDQISATNMDNINELIIDRMNQEEKELEDIKNTIYYSELLPKESKLINLYDTLDKHIENKKKQIKDINILFKSVVAKHINLNKQEDHYDSKIKTHETSDIVNSKNYDNILNKNKKYNFRFYIVVIIFISLTLCVLYFGYKLFREFMAY